MNSGKQIGNVKFKFDCSQLLEKTGKTEFKRRKGKDIYVNVDFYSASLYHAMGIPIDLFTPVFAISRIAGWTAHVIEEYFAVNAVYRSTLIARTEMVIAGNTGRQEAMMRSKKVKYKMWHSQRDNNVRDIPDDDHVRLDGTIVAKGDPYPNHKGSYSNIPSSVAERCYSVPTKSKP